MITSRDGHGHNDLRQMYDNERFGPAFTGLCDDYIIGCAGVRLQHQGMGSAWAVLTDKVEQHKMWFTRVVREILWDTIRAFKLHRVECCVLANNYNNIAFVEWLGFTEEGGVARAFTVDKQDVIRFELVIKD